jgi:soluble lytic murein transglycosylase-like protein
MLAFMEIKIADIWFSNEKDYYNLSEKTTTALYEMSEREKEETTIQNTQITSAGYDSAICDASSKYYPQVSQYVANEQEFRALVKAIMLQESTGDYTAISPGCGAVGLMQIMPRTAQELNMKVYGLNINDQCVYKVNSGCDSTYASCMIQLKQGKTQQELIAIDDRFDASKSIIASTEYLTKQINQLESLELGIAAYYAGAGNVQKYCSFKNNVLTCTGSERKPTPDQYASQVMAKKQLIQKTGVTC